MSHPQRLMLLALVVPALTIGTTSVARADVTENVTVPVEIAVYIPCAAGAPAQR